MRRDQGPLVLVMALAMAACGGGGSAGSDPGGGTGNGDGGGSGNADPNGTAVILFPWSHSTATSPTVTIRGVAADPEGVASVVVNGIAATIVATGSASTGNLHSKSDLAEGEVEWSAEVELAKGENALTVSVEDNSGNVTEDIDTATIKYVEVPTTFTLDPDGARVVGLSYTLTSSGYVQNLVQYDYETLEQTIFPGIGLAPATSCFRQFENEFLYLSFFTGTWELRVYDLDTEQDSLLMQLPSAALDGGAGFQSGSVRQLVCGGTHTSAYVLVNHVEDDGDGHSGSAWAKSRVLEIDLASRIVTTLSESDPVESPRWIASQIALAEDRIVSMRDLDPVMPLTGISLLDGTRNHWEPTVDVGGMALAPALAQGRVYVATFEGVDEIDLVAGTRRNISVVEDNHPLTFSQVRSIGFDPVNNRVIVGDDALDTLIAIDIATGERSEFLTRKVGTGTALIAPRAFAISADASRAYVADDGDNAPARLFEIDLATGDRRVISDISQPFNVVVTGLTLDEAGNRVFVSFPDVILEVDLETQETTTIATTDVTVLESIRGLLLDAGNGRLIVGDPSNDGIFTLDLATHAVDVISQENVRGEGPAFGVVVSLTRVAGTPEVYAAGQASGTVTRVDLETGDREELLTTCDKGLSPIFQNLDQVLYNQDVNELIISGDTLYRLELDTGDCEVLPRRILPLQIRMESGSRMLAVTFGALTQIDRTTGEVVIVSK